MNILAFDTCFDACSACVAEQHAGAVAVKAAAVERFETGHAERLIPMIGEVMREAGLSFDALHRIVVTTGPGTFTGMRIGVAAARALALATGAETVAASSLAVMAERARRQVATSLLAVAVDARRGEAYVQLFGPAGGLDALGPPQLLSIAAAAEIGDAQPVTFVGSAAVAIAAAATASGRSAQAALPELVPDAEALAIIGAALPVTEAPTPLYLRPPDAKPQAGKTAARA